MAELENSENKIHELLGEIRKEQDGKKAEQLFEQLCNESQKLQQNSDLKDMVESLKKRDVDNTIGGQLTQTRLAILDLYFAIKEGNSDLIANAIDKYREAAASSLNVLPGSDKRRGDNLIERAEIIKARVASELIDNADEIRKSAEMACDKILNKEITLENAIFDLKTKVREEDEKHLSGLVKYILVNKMRKDMKDVDAVLEHLSAKDPEIAVKALFTSLTGEHSTGTNRCQKAIVDNGSGSVVDYLTKVAKWVRETGKDFEESIQAAAEELIEQLLGEIHTHNNIIRGDVQKAQAALDKLYRVSQMLPSNSGLRGMVESLQNSQVALNSDLSPRVNFWNETEREAYHMAVGSTEARLAILDLHFAIETGKLDLIKEAIDKYMRVIQGHDESYVGSEDRLPRFKSKASLVDRAKTMDQCMNSGPHDVLFDLYKNSGKSLIDRAVRIEGRETLKAARETLETDAKRVASELSSQCLNKSIIEYQEVAERYRDHLAKEDVESADVLLAHAAAVLITKNRSHSSSVSSGNADKGKISSKGAVSSEFKADTTKRFDSVKPRSIDQNKRSSLQKKR